MLAASRHGDGLPRYSCVYYDVVNIKRQFVVGGVLPADVFRASGNGLAVKVPLHIGSGDGFAKGERFGLVVRRAEAHLESLWPTCTFILIIKYQIHAFGIACQFG